MRQREPKGGSHMVTPVKDESLVEHAGAGQGADHPLHEIVHRQQCAPPQAHHLIEMILVLPIQRQIRRHPRRLPLRRVVVGSEVARALDALELVSVPRRWEVRRVRRARGRRDHEGAVLRIRHDPLHRLVADDRGGICQSTRSEHLCAAHFVGYTTDDSHSSGSVPVCVILPATESTQFTS